MVFIESPSQMTTTVRSIDKNVVNAKIIVCYRINMLLLKSWESWGLVQASVSLWTGVWIQGDFWQLLLPPEAHLFLLS